MTEDDDEWSEIVEFTGPMNPDDLGPCKWCGFPIEHDEKYLSIYPRFNCHGLQMVDDSITPGDYHHECLTHELDFHDPGRLDADDLQWLLYCLGYVDREEL